MFIARAWTKEKKIKIRIFDGVVNQKSHFLVKFAPCMVLKNYWKQRKKILRSSSRKYYIEKCAKFEEDRFITFWEIVTTDFKNRVSRKKRLNFYIQVTREIFFF